MNNLIIGSLFALCAAALNASIGVISKLLMHSGLNPQDIAFLKTIIAFFLFKCFFYLKCLLAKSLPLLAAHQVNSAFLLKLPYVLFLGIFLFILFRNHCL